jgi:hypothetical protein
MDIFDIIDLARAYFTGMADMNTTHILEALISNHIDAGQVTNFDGIAPELIEFVRNIDYNIK